jgi:hypothetical protein
MDSSSIMEEIEQSLHAQIQLAGETPGVVEAGEAMLAGLEPAIDRAVAHLAEQAASEVEAQLVGYRVGVELREGTPVLVVHGEANTVKLDADDLEARITLRLSEKLKSIVEEAAGESGESINTFVVKTLASKARERRSGGRFSGIIET